MSESKYTLVLVRHGESEWNRENRFTGWTDVDLSEEGENQARQAGKMLGDAGFIFDRSFTSVLKRSVRTNNFILDNLDLAWLPVTKAWQLNERHYGALQGLNKAEIATQYGEAQVKEWRRSYSTRPPALGEDDQTHPSNDRRYKDVSRDLLPGTESLADAVARVVPYWQHDIAPLIIQGERIIIVAHGNSLRALIMHLDGMSEGNIAELNIPVGTPLVYTLNQDLQPIEHHYLGDQEAIARQIAEVANQGKASA
jgi:2,3-bisphosphoglycerate-dependent phosphoglycerate mutase